MGILYDLASMFLKKEMDDSDINDVSKAIQSNFGKMNSITKMAKDAVMSYPVIFSEAVAGSNDELVIAISRYLETQYGIFTMVAMGLNPVLDTNDARDHIIKYYTEEGEDITVPGIDEQDPVISLSADDGSDDVELSLINDERKTRKMSEEDLKFYKYSNEAIQKKAMKTSGLGKKDKDDDYVNVKFKKLEQKARMSDPTMINIKFKMENGTPLEIPLAVKAMPRIITTAESERIFQYLREGKVIPTLIKLMSGEVSLFKDIIFQVDNASKDKELYAKLGRHPWFREVFKRKTNRKINGIVQLLPVFKDFIRSPQEIMPICSLVVTKDEIERGYGSIWSKIKDNNEKLMDKMMLLCICVVDTTTSVVEFDFYGMKHTTVMKASTLIKEAGEAKDGKDMEKLLQALIYKV